METKRFKRLPYGISNFKRLRADNYIYVDKTRFIEYMEEENNPYQFFIRPRKFGKSLLFSMLSHYYDLNQAQDSRARSPYGPPVPPVQAVLRSGGGPTGQKPQ